MAGDVKYIRMSKRSAAHRFSGTMVSENLNRVIRRIHLDRGSGILEVTPDDGTKKRLFFLNGELYLPPSNPIAQQLEGMLSDGLSTELRRLMGRFARVIGSWREGRFSFAPGRAGVPPDVIGPLLTREVVMAGATQDLSPDAMLDRLGGEKARWSTQAHPEALTLHPDSGAAAVGLDPREAFLIDRIRAQPCSVAALLQMSGLAREETLEILSRLQAVGMIEREARPTVNRELVTLPLLERFSERVKQELETHGVDLPEEEHRSHLADLLSRLGEMGHYDLLNVDANCEGDEIHRAYSQLARLVHPSQAKRLGLAGREEGMYLLFERATESYLVLSDPERRASYDRDLVSGGLVGTESSEEQEERRHQRARENYRRAQELFHQEEFHYALEILREAVRLEQQPEYYSLMAKVQERNPKWLRHATDSYRTALKLDPEALDIRMAMAELYERVGDLGRARAAYRSILIRRSDHPAASEALERLTQERGPKRGLLKSIFGRD